MTIDLFLVGIGLLGLAVAALSQRLRQLPISEPLLALGLGVLLGPEVAGLLDLAPLTDDPARMHEGARVLLAISVMGVALRFPVGVAWRCRGPVTVLLLLAMPGMALLSSAVAWWSLGIPLAAAALLGTAVAPTDPVLASSVVSGKYAEEDLPERDRALLSLESGFNDGLALPLVLAALALAGAATGREALLESLWQVVGAVLVGAALGWVGGHALRSGEEHGATARGPALLLTVVLALAILGISGLAHTDGVLAVFVGGLVFNAVSTGSDRLAELSIDEAVNRYAVLPLFLLLGATVPWAEWAGLGWRGAVLVAGVLVLRRLPILLALARPLGLRLRDALYLGWFGPVGVSALFYLTLESERLATPSPVLAAGALVVAASTVVHGLTGTPGRVAYRRAAERGARPRPAGVRGSTPWRSTRADPR